MYSTEYRTEISLCLFREHNPDLRVEQPTATQLLNHMSYEASLTPCTEINSKNVFANIVFHFSNASVITLCLMYSNHKDAIMSPLCLEPTVTLPCNTRNNPLYSLHRIRTTMGDRISQSVQQ